MFANFDSGFHAKSKPTLPPAKGGKKPTFQVPDTKELMSVFNLDEAGPSKLPPKLPPKEATSMHDTIMKRAAAATNASPKIGRAHV